MAVNETNYKGTSWLKRVFLGANVTVAVLLVVFLVVAANFIANKGNLRRDLSGGLTGYRLSDQTKGVLKKSGPVTVSTVYTSNDPEKNYKDYLPKLRDFCDELKRASSQVKVEHVSSPDDQAALRERVSSKFGSATGKHKQSVEKALALWDKLKATIDAQQQALEQLGGGQAWLKNFSSLAARTSDLNRLSKSIEDNSKEVKDLVGEALPKYSEASSKITTVNDDVKTKLQEYQKWAAEMDKLAKELANPTSDFVKTTRERNQDITKMIAQLREIAGDPKDTNIPEDPIPVLQKYGLVAKTLSDLLYDEASRVQQYLKTNPGLSKHRRWSVRVDLSSSGLPIQQVMSMETLLGQTAEEVSQAAQVLKSVLRQEVPKDQLQNLIRQLRSSTGEWVGSLKAWTEASVAPFDEAGKIDEASKKFLADVSSGEPFKDMLKEIETIATAIKELPQQKMDEVGERLKQDNIVVVETDKEVRILPFDEVWPLADRQASRFGKEGDSSPNRRDFNGDSAVCNAMLDMQSDKKIATVILVSYESQPPPQMRQFQRPTTGPIPMEELTTLRERLERANFAVKDWNLSAPEAGPQEQPGAPKPVPNPPDPEKDTDPIYVFLPPAEAPQANPFMMQAPQKGFGPQEMAKVKEVLSKPKVKAIFLAAAMPQMGNMPETHYGYDQYLQDDWGIKVEYPYKIVRAVPSSKSPGMYSFDPIQFNHMRLNNFTDQAIGKPMRSRRMLMLHACPVTKARDLPDVQITPVLEIPERSRDMWGEGDLTPMIKSLREHSKDTFFTPSNKSIKPPFPVMLVAENKKTESKIVVTGGGMSLMNYYLDSPVPRLDKEGEVRFTTDPPPTENIELFANSLYWLENRPELIAAGPADVPFVGPIEEKTQQKLWFVTMGWALAIMVVGAGVMFMRRK